MMAPAPQRGLYADLLPPPAPTLRSLWLAAADASEAVSAGYREGLDIDTMVVLKGVAFDAEQALKDHLLTEHGLTTADLKRGVL